MKTMKVMRKLMMTVALGATVFAALTGFCATETKDGVTYTYTVASDAATINGVTVGSVTEVTIPSTLGGYPVTALGQSAFDISHSDTRYITSVVIPSGVTTIGDYAFYGCELLVEVVFDGDAPTMGYSVFSYVASDAKAYVRRDSTGFGDEGSAWHGLTVVYREDGAIPVGQYLNLDLVKALCIEIPDVDYAKGDKVTVKVEGLAKGLKLVATQQKETTGRKAVTNVVYTIEGVPTETIDFETQPAVVRRTVPPSSTCRPPTYIWASASPEPCHKLNTSSGNCGLV